MPIDPSNIGQATAAYDAIRGAGVDPNIDKLTQKELLKGISELDSVRGHWGDNLDFVGTQLNKLNDIMMGARAGTGVYAVRKINENQRNVVAAQPGRAQLLAARLGAQRTQAGNSNELGDNSQLGSFF